MALQWMMRTERVGYEDAIVDALRAGWEPFAVGLDEEEENAIFFKKQVFVEDSEKSSAFQETWVGVPGADH
jgi:hypothetical protein